MKKLVVTLVVLGCLVLPGLSKDAVTKTFADQLPADKVVVYAEVDIENLLKSSAEMLKMIDAKKGESIVTNIEQFKDLMKQGLAEDNQFKPKVFDEMHKIKIYFAGMRSENETMDFEKMVEPFVVFETSSEEVSKNFADELVGLLKRENKSVKEVKMDNATLYVESKPGTESGKMGGFAVSGKYIVVGMGDFKNFLSNLNGTVANSFGATTIYQNYLKNYKGSHGYAYMSLKPIIKIAKEASKNDKNGLLAMRLTSLEKFKYVEFNFSSTINATTITTNSYFGVHYEKPLSNIMKSFLNGGAPLSKVGRIDGLAVLFRFGLSELADEFVTEFMKDKTDAEATSFWEQLDDLKKQFGVDVLDVAGSFAGDFYFFLDIVKKDYIEREYDFENDVMKEVKKNGPRPEMELLAGVKDGKEATELVESFFSSPAITAEAEAFSKRKYKERIIYVFGDKGGDQRIKPTGFESYALVVMGNYIKMGSWKSVTDFVDNYKKLGEAAIPAWLQKNKNAHWISKVSKDFQQKIIDLINANIPGGMMAAAVGLDDTDFMKQMIVSSIQKALDDIPFTNEKLKEEMGTALVQITNDYFELAKSVPESSSTTVAGEKAGDKDGCYAITSIGEMKIKKK